MTRVPVSAIWVRRVQRGEFFNIERNPELVGPTSGGGARYIEIPTSLVDGTLAFIESERDTDGLPVGQSINAFVIGAPDISQPLVFEPKAGGRLRIANQNRQATPNRRHPAWTTARGFPQAPDGVASADEAAGFLPEGGLRVFVVKTGETQPRYWAGFTTGDEIPGGWPRDPRLAALFEAATGEVIWMNAEQGSLWEEAIVARIFDSWKRGKGALLYGPPGTGKTRILSVLYSRLSSARAGRRLVLNTENQEAPFEYADMELPIPSPVRIEWVTFHQSYSYEDFMVGLRPLTIDGGLSFRPRLGVFLDLAFDVFDRENETLAGVVFIDEINRGNAARIFGELMTFLDMDYRASDAAGGDNPLRLPISLPSLSVDVSGAQTEEIDRWRRGSTRVPVPWYFPRHVYLLASMNSVDRAAIPLDSALARRFDRIELRPNLELLAEHLGVAELSERAHEIRVTSDTAWLGMTAQETAILLLDRLNQIIAVDLGEDFELGHGLLWPLGGIDEQEAWDVLAQLWDEALFPQMQERFLGRSRELAEALKVDNAPADQPFAYVRRSLLGQTSPDEEAPAAQVRLSGLAAETARVTLRWLAR